jgi:hypothetical protein
LIFSVDSVVTIVELFKTKNIISQIEKISRELSEKAEVKYFDFQVKYHRSKKEFTEHVIELKNKLTNKLETLPAKSVTNRVKIELNKLGKYIDTSRRLNRFYKKYPNSKSFVLFQVIKTLENLPRRNKEES